MLYISFLFFSPISNMASNDANTDSPSMQHLPEISTVQVPVPRIAITFCTKCKWNLRAAYVCSFFFSGCQYVWSDLSAIITRIPHIVSCFPTNLSSDADIGTPQFAQELLSTFGEALGEVSMIPSKGGIFVVDIWCQSPKTDTKVIKRTIWDRKVDGGFPGKSGTGF